MFTRRWVTVRLLCFAVGWRAREFVVRRISAVGRCRSPVLSRNCALVSWRPRGKLTFLHCPYTTYLSSHFQLARGCSFRLVTRTRHRQGIYLTFFPWQIWPSIQRSEKLVYVSYSVITDAILIPFFLHSFAFFSSAIRKPYRNWLNFDSIFWMCGIFVFVSGH